jgi:hypothetical protein
MRLLWRLGRIWEDTVEIDIKDSSLAGEYGFILLGLVASPFLTQ